MLEDYQEFQKYEKEQRLENQANFYAKLKESAMTVKTTQEDDIDKKLEEEFEDMEDDEFMKEYRMKRMRELYAQQRATKKNYGTFLSLNSSNFVAEIDKEGPQTLIVVHVYEPDIASCEAMNGCLIVLAGQHPTVKFCRIRASEAKMSAQFVKQGLPALLVYQDKQLIGNFCAVAKFLGNDFFAKDVERFLQEHGLLCEREPSKLLGSPRVVPVEKEPAVSKKIRQTQVSSDDSD